MALGKKIRHYREQKGWGQQELSDRTGGVVSQPTISQIERRDSKSSEYVSLLAEALEVSVDQLLEESELELNTITQEKPKQLENKQAKKLAEIQAGYDHSQTASDSTVHESGLSQILDIDSIEAIKQMDEPSIKMLESLINNYLACDDQGKANLAFSGEIAKAGSNSRSNAKKAEDKKIKVLRGSESADTETNSTDQ